MDMSFAGAAILAVAVPAAAVAETPKPAVAAPAPKQAGSSGEMGEKSKCSQGSLRKRLAGQPWILSVCDRAMLIVSADEGNPAKPFLFFLLPHRGGHRFAQLTIRFPDRSVTPPLPEVAAAARDELLALKADEMAALIASVRVPGEASPPAPDYEEQWIGAWLLRTDRKARTPGDGWIDTGVIELSAASLDGNARIQFRDNGTLLAANLRTPACAAGARALSYDGEARSEGTPAHFAAQAANCPKHGYEAEIRSWMKDFPAAIGAMKARARALYGASPARCIEPIRDPEDMMPQHPTCGFPPPEIGENHPEPW